MIAIAELRGTHINNKNVIACDRCIEFLSKSFITPTCRQKQRWVRNSRGGVVYNKPLRLEV